jgi:lipopolysaccharide export system permease protein
MESFNYLDSTGYNISLERFENYKVSQRVFANRLLWNRETQNWRLEYYQRRLFKNGIEIIEKGNTLDTSLRISPDEFVVKSQFVSSMTNPELNEYIKREKEKGSASISKYYVELYKRIATPFSFFILTLLAIAISSRKSRGGTGLHLGIGIFLTFTFLLVIQVFNTLGVTNVLPPAIAVWIPNVLFMIIALLMTKSAPK